jgi:hypothetical protein
MRPAALPGSRAFLHQEKTMKATTSVLLAGLAFSLLAACNKAPQSAQSSNDPTPGSSPAVSAAPPGGSVALPADKAPASDAAIAPSTPSTASSGGSGSAAQGKSGDANSQTQANPADLKKEQEQAAMPQTGQVNNHSAPDAAGTQGTPK